MAFGYVPQSASDTMLAGYKLAGSQQAFGNFIALHNGKATAACALGALALGAGLTAQQAANITPERERIFFQYLNNIKAVNPATNDGIEFSLRTVIEQLNDTQRWTIPQIATWLKTALAL